MENERAISQSRTLRLRGNMVHTIYKERGVGSYINVEMNTLLKVLVSQRHLEIALEFRQETNLQTQAGKFPAYKY